MLVRHGETVGNREKIAHGQSESPLTATGRLQARYTAEFLASLGEPFDRVYSSPLSRAQETARVIAEHHALPVHTHPGLMEGHLGVLEGVTYSALREFGFARRAIADDNFVEHKGESPRSLALRVANAIAEIKTQHAGERIVVVSHGGAISHCLAYLNNESPIFGPQYIMHNGAATELHYEDKPRLGRFNMHAHIPLALRAASPGPGPKR